jgi:SulP family sulfate permease
MPCCAVLVMGPAFLAYFPKPILGSLLLFLGLDLLWQWLIKAWFKFFLVDYLIIIATLVTIGIFGLMPGILLGIGLASLQFLYGCSRFPVLGAANQTQQVDLGTGRHPVLDSQVLSSEAFKGQALEHLSLRGFIFFGNAASLYERLRSRLLTSINSEPTHNTAIKSLLLDFSQVYSLDASGVLTFNKLLKLAQGHRVTLIYVGLSDALRAKLLKGSALEAIPKTCHTFDCCEQALSWWQVHQPERVSG